MPADSSSTTDLLNFPRPLATVDVVILTLGASGLRVLLVQRPAGAGEPFPKAWALPGGFVDVQQDADLQARARAELVRLDALARQAGPLSAEEHARLLVQAAMAGAQYERDEMQLLLDAAHDLERRLMADDEFRWPVILARELEGDLLLTTDRPAAASERYRDLLVEWPRRVQSRIGLAAAYRRQGFVREADETLAQARALWAGADPDAIALVR